MLVEAAWEAEHVSDENVAQCIADIRRVLADTHKRIVQTVPRQGYRLALPQVAQCTGTAENPSIDPRPTIQDAPVASGTGPVIAVLPFDDFGIHGISADTLLAALSEAIIIDLARYPELTVLSRIADLPKAPALPLKRLVRKLNADYLVTGGLQSDGSHARVSVQLVSAHDLSYLWVDEVDLDISEYSDLSRWIGRHVANAIGAKIIDLAETRLGLGDVSAMLIECAARSRMLRFSSREAYQQNIAEQEVALQLYPEAAWGNFGQALALRVGIDAGWIVEDIDAERSRAETLATRALAIAPENYLAHYAIGRTLAGKGEMRPAIKAFEKAAHLNPSSVLIVTGLVDPHLNLGNTARALELIAQAERINPLRTRELSYKKARTYWQMGDPNQARRILEAIPGRTAEQGKLLSIVHCELGNMKAARQVLLPFLAENRDWSISRERGVLEELQTPLHLWKAWLSALNNAGMPQ